MKYSEKQMVEAIRGSGGIVSVVARRLGCGRATIYRYCDRFPSVAEALENEREVLLDAAEKGLFDAAEGGDLYAIIFALKTLGKDRGYHFRVDIARIVEDEVETILDALAKRLNRGEFEKVARIIADARNAA